MAAIENIVAILLFSIWLASLGYQQAFGKALGLALVAVVLGIFFALLYASCVSYLLEKYTLVWMLFICVLLSVIILLCELSLFLSALAFALSYQSFQKLPH